MAPRYESAQAAYAAWAALYDANADQETRLKPGMEPDDAWATRVDVFRPGRPVPPDVPVTVGLLQPSDTLLDVGAGSGLRTLALAPHVAAVRALDGSPAMTEALREEARSVSNLEVLEPTFWPPAQGLGQSDVVYAAQVTYYVREIDAFLDAFEAHARRLCLIVSGERAGGSPPPDVFTAVHGEPYAELPARDELISVLEARGASPAVERVGLDDWPQPALSDAIMRVLCFVTEGTQQDAILKAALRARFGEDPPRYRAFSEYAVIAWEPPA